jgi:hypothetical protein
MKALLNEQAYGAPHIFFGNIRAGWCLVAKQRPDLVGGKGTMTNLGLSGSDDAGQKSA